MQIIIFFCVIGVDSGVQKLAFRFPFYKGVSKFLDFIALCVSLVICIVIAWCWKYYQQICK